MRIEVCQHIFSNVSKDQSPRGRRGFQTLFYTRDNLSDDEVFILEDRAQYYSGDQEPKKWQFFTLPDSKAVVSQIVPIAELDEFGRKGRYLSHSLILSRSDLHKLENCPLSLFLSNLFISDLETALKEGDRTTGNIPSKEIQVSDDWQDRALQAVQGWSSEELIQLTRLGWQAEELRNQRQSIALVGNSDEIFSVLATIFLLTQPNKRSFLTFDTYAYGCDWNREWPFWVWGGLSEDDTKKTTFRIDASTHQVQADLSDKYDSPFERWVTREAISTRLEFYQVHQQDALILTDVLEGQKRVLDNVDKSFAKDFARINSDLIEQRISSHLPEELSASSLNQILGDVRSHPWDYLEQLGVGITVNNVAEILFNLLAGNLGMPSNKTEHQAITRFAKGIDHVPLLNILDLQDGNLSNWQKRLKYLSEDTYRYIAKAAVSQRIAAPSDAFCPLYIRAWCEEMGMFLQPGALKNVLHQLKKYKGGFKADDFMPILPFLTPQDQALLAKWLHSYDGSAPQLRAVLNVSKKSSVSVLDRIKSFIGRHEK